jgi:hypothetical protein
MAEYDHLAEFKFSDYAKAAKQAEEGGLQEEINEAAIQQEERARDPETGQFISSTPDGGIDWEQRYKELEKLNSRQAQEVGTLRQETAQYRTAFDEYLLNDSLTPSNEAKQVSNHITSDDLFDRPDEAINQAIENHPAIRDAREVAEAARRQAILDAKGQFEARHPKYQETMSDPAFANWVAESNTRVSLAQRADAWDFEAADALFSLYESERALQGITQQASQAQAIEQATLESAGVGEPPPTAQYSRTEMREIMINAKRGDATAERYLETHLPKYRAALANGQVTD